MKHFKSGFAPLIPALLLAGVATSCVDHDYDLSKDIDLTVNVGGDLALPTSSTEQYTMAQILNLNGNSSIKPDGELYGLAEGDYVLVQGGDPTVTDVSIPVQSMSDIECNPTSIVVPFVGTGSSAEITITMPEIKNDVSIADSQFDESVVSLSHAVTDIAMTFNVSAKAPAGVTGTVAFEPGFTVEFPEQWDIAIADNSLKQFATVHGHKLVFDKRRSVSVNQRLALPMKVVAVDLTTLPEGQGLYAPGRFRLEDYIVTSGPVSFSTGSLALGQRADIEFEILPEVPTAQIFEVTGCVDPKVTIDPASFAINDVPEFLKEPGNNLDIDNPQVYITVVNQSPVEVNINCRLLARDENGNEQIVWIGDEHGTDPVRIAASATTDICISRLGTGAPAGGTNVKVPDLTKLIATIPESITFDNVSAKVPRDREFTFKLGSPYSFRIDYKAVVPLAFGSDLKFTYSTESKNWGEDLSKYSFKEMVASVSVVNTIPLDMTPEVVALDSHGNPIDDVVATVEGVVTAGTVAAPTTTQLKVNLTSDSANIGKLDGVRFTFTAKCPDGMTGVPLNAKQSLRFTDIKLKLKGGVGIDLN